MLYQTGGNMENPKVEAKKGSPIKIIIIIVAVILGVCIVLPICIIVLLSLLGPAIGNIFSDMIISI
jgi:hypothetical protein